MTVSSNRSEYSQVRPTNSVDDSILKLTLDSDRGFKLRVCVSLKHNSLFADG